MLGAKRSYNMNYYTKAKSYWFSVLMAADDI